MSSLLNSAVGVSSEPKDNSFRIIVEIPADDLSYVLGIQNITSINIDWGDGEFDTGVTANNPSHTYLEAGTYEIAVSGRANSANFFGVDSVHRLKLKEVINLGTLGLTGFRFQGCTNMTSFVAGNCDKGTLTSLYEALHILSTLENIDISTLDVSSVTQASRIFRKGNSFTNLDVSNWDTSSFELMPGLFQECFSLKNLKISDWDVSSVTDASNFLNNTGNLNTGNLGPLTRAEYDKTLVNWAAQSVQSNVPIDFGVTKYSANSAAADARQTLVDTYGWIITDGGVEDAPFQMTVQTTTANEVFEIPCSYSATAFDATIDWGDGTTSTITSFSDPDLVHTYATAGTYQIEITGLFKSISFSNQESRNKVLSVDNLGTLGWTSIRFSCPNMTSFTPGTCSTTEVTSMSNMLFGCSSLTSLDLTALDTSNVTNMSQLVYGCSSLVTLDYSTWDTSKVTNMNRMHRECTSLQTVSFADWDVSSVQDFQEFFNSCGALTTADVSKWDTSSATTFFRMFQGCSSLSTIDVSGFETRNITGIGLDAMFAGCGSVTTLDVSRFNTKNCTSFSSMFNGCGLVTELDVSGFDTSNVTNMAFMFRACGSLTSLDLSNFDTSNVTSMSTMFEYCNDLTSLDLSNFDTSNVTNMTNMFRFTDSLTSLNVSSFNTSKVTGMSQMFRTCGAPTLDVSSFDTSLVTNMFGIFSNSANLNRTIGVENFNIENTTSISTTFYITRTEYDKLLLNWEAQPVQNDQSFTVRSRYSANSLAAQAKQRLIDDHNWVISDFGEEDAPMQFTIQTTTDNETFSITNGSLGSFDAIINWGDGTTSEITVWNDPDRTHTYTTAGTYQISISGEFGNIEFSTDSREKVISVDNLGTNGLRVLNLSRCTNLATFTAGTTSTSDFTGRALDFSFCTSLTELDLTSFDVSNVTSIGYSFRGCSALTLFDISTWDVSNITQAGRFIWQCNSLTDLRLPPKFVHKNSVTMDHFFVGIPISELDVSDWDTSSVTTMANAFNGCSQLTELDVSNWDVSNVTNMQNLFSGCSGLTKIDISNWDTSNVTNMNNLFANCTSFTDLNDYVPYLDTSSLTNISRIFLYYAGEELDVRNFNTSNVTSFSEAFFRIPNVKVLDVSGFDTSNVTSYGGMFADMYDLTDVIGIENFNLENVTSDMPRFLGGYNGRSTLNTPRYHKMLINYSQQNLPIGISADFGNAKYSANSSAADARQSMIDTYGWTITDGGFVDAPFRFTIETTTTNESFTIPCQNIGTFDATIDWGDGSATQTITAYNDANLTHTFASAGTYQIEISGKFPNIRFFDDSTSAVKVISVDNLGTTGWQSFSGAFSNCSNMTSFTPGTTSTLDVTNMGYMFSGCSSLTTLDLTAFDTSNVTTMVSMFIDCSNLVSVDLSNFDTSNVTTMEAMFFRCSSLTSVDVTSFDTSNVTLMNGMFGVCDSIVGEGALDVSGFDTSNVTNMTQMFRRTQVPDLDLRNFDTSKVTGFDFTFEGYGYPDEDVQGIETFDVSSVTDFNTASAGFSTERYDAMLINYSGQSLQSNVDFRVGDSKYTPGGDAEAARTALINIYEWVITDGGPVT